MNADTYVEKRRLQAWANAHTPSDEMLWKSSYWDQIIFVRDQIASMLARSYEEYKDLVDVSGEHTSKSITCPVYFIDLKDYGVRIWMRYNYYDWNVSVESERHITCDFLDTFSDNDYSYCFCQGMEDKKFSTYKDNDKKFTVCIGDKYNVYTFLKCLKKFLGIKREDK